MKKKICNLSVTFFLILSMIFGMTVTAFAAEEDAIYTASASINTGAIYTIHSSINRNYVLDVAGASKANGAKIQIYKANGTAAQKFVFKKNADGSYTITNPNAGRVIDVPGNSKKVKTQLQLYTSNGSKAQRFFAVDNGDVTFSFRNASSGLYLDISGGIAANKRPVWMYRKNGSKAQRFILKQVGGQASSSAGTGNSSGNTQSGSGTLAQVSSGTRIYSGATVILSAANRNYAVDIANGSTANSANVQLYKVDGSDAQRFRIEHVSGDYHRIINTGSGKVLDVKGGKNANGTNVQQYAWNGTKAQLWRIEANLDGSYTLHSGVDDEKVLDLSGAKIYNGSNFQIYKSNGSAAQRFFMSGMKAASSTSSGSSSSGSLTSGSGSSSGNTSGSGSGSTQEGSTAGTTGTQATVLMNMTNAQIIALVGPMIAANSKQNGTLASARIAMFIQESGWGKSGLAQKANNLFGMLQGSGKVYPGSGWDGKTVYTATSAPYMTYRKYVSIEASIADQGALLSGSNNYKACTEIEDPEEFLAYIEAYYWFGKKQENLTVSEQQAIDDYIASCMRNIEKYNLTKYDS